MRPIGVAEAFEFGQLDAQLAGAGLVELAAAGGVGALDAAVAIGAFGRQRERVRCRAAGRRSRTRPRTRCRRRPAPTRGRTASGGSGGRGILWRRRRWRASRRACSTASSRAPGLGLLDREAGLDGDAQVVDPDHLAGLAPAVAAAPAPRNDL